MATKRQASMASNQGDPDQIKHMTVNSGATECPVHQCSRPTCDVCESNVSQSPPSDPDLASSSLQTGFEVDLRNTDNYPSGNEQMDVAQMRLEQDASNKMCTTGISSAFSAACFPGRSDALQVLDDAGSNPDREDTSSATPLLESSRERRTDIVDMLLPDGTDIRQADKEGRTALHIASSKGCKEVVSLILQAGADVNTRTYDGRNAIYLACEAQFEDVVLELLENSADVDISDNNGTTPLHICARHGSFEMVERLTKSGANVNVVHSTNASTPLHIACEGGHFKLSGLLVGVGSDVNARQESGDTPLLLAVRKGNASLVGMLLEAQSDINANDAKGNTPLIAACQLGYYEVVSTLLKFAGQDLKYSKHPLSLLCLDIDTRNPEGESAISVASTLGLSKIVKLLLDAGAKIDRRKTETGETALFLACKNGHTDVALLLLAAGADGNTRNMEGITALQVACSNGHKETVHLLIQHRVEVNAKKFPEGVNALFMACDGGSFDVAEELVNSGADVNILGCTGITPLYMASRYGKSDMVKLFIDAGANVNIASSCNSSAPLHVACQEGYLEVAKHLIDAGCEIDIAQQLSGTPLFQAVLNNHVPLVKLLLDAGADVNFATDITNKTPLIVACEQGHEAVVSELLNFSKPGISDSCIPRYSARPDVNFCTSHGRSALYTASERGFSNIVRRLIDSGAKLNQKDKDGTTPLIVASCFGHSDIVDTLLAKGANVMIRYTNGATVLHVASSMGHKTAVQLLIKTDIDINAKDCSGETALHLACQCRHHDVIQELVYNGADVNIPDSTGMTLLHQAAECGVPVIAKLLIRSGANINALYQPTMSTPLHVACGKGHYDVAKLLINASCDIDAMRIAGDTALFQAVLRKDLRLFELLVMSGADTNATVAGVTSLYMACQQGCNEIVAALLNASHSASAASRKFNVNVCSATGKSPLYITSQCGFQAIVELLLRSGANIEHRYKVSGTTPLFVASSTGNTEVVDTLLAYGADANTRDIKGKSVLQEACQQGYKDIVSSLIRAGADVNFEQPAGVNALYYACDIECIDVVKLLVSNGAQVNRRAPNGTTPLYSASRKGHADVVKILLDSGADVNILAEDASPLHVACEQGHVEVTKYLIDSGCEINKQRGSDRRPLHMATKNRRLPVVSCLLALRADVNAATPDGKTALHLACENNDIMCVHKLIMNGGNVDQLTNTGDSPLHLACCHGHNETSQILLASNADVNVRNHNLHTPLHIACREGHLEILSLFLVSGLAFDVNACDKYQATPLHYACAGANCLMAKLLIQLGGNVNAPDGVGATPIFQAAHRGHYTTVKMLLEAGANVDFKVRQRATPLHAACKEGHLHIVQLLHSFGCDVNIASDARSSPLKVACLFEHVNVLEYLLDRGANVNAGSETGDSPLITALSNNSVDIMEMLIKHKADVNSTWQTQLTPIYLGCLTGKLQCSEILLKAGADVNIIALNDNTTVLHSICMFIAGRISFDPDVPMSTITSASQLFSDIFRESTSITALSDHQTSALDILLCSGNYNEPQVMFCIKQLLRVKHDLTKNLYVILPNNRQSGARFNDKWSFHTTFSSIVCRLPAEDIGMLIFSKDAGQETSALFRSVNYLQQNVWHILARDEAIHGDYAEKLKMLLSEGFNTHVRDINGRTPLHVASICASFELLEQLVQACDFEDALTEDNVGKTVIQYIGANKNISEAQRILFSDLIQLRTTKGITSGFGQAYTEVNESTIEHAIATPFHEELTRDATLDLKTFVNQLVDGECITMLTTDGIGRLEMTGENALIYQEVQNFVHLICKLVSKSHTLFECEAHLSGSVGEGSKVGKLDELDFIFDLKNLNEFLHVTLEQKEDELFALLNPEKPTAFENYWRTGDKLSSILFADTKFSADFWSLFMQVLSHPQMTHFLKNSRLTVEDLRRKSGFVGTMSVTWHGKLHSQMAVSIDILPAFKFLSESYVCLLRPRHSDNELVGRTYSRGLELSSQPSDKELLQSFDRSIIDGYCLAKIVRNLAYSFKTASGEIMQAGEVLQSYLMKCTLFWIMDPLEKFREVYPSLCRNWTFSQEDQDELLADTMEACDEAIDLCNLYGNHVSNESSIVENLTVKVLNLAASICSDLNPSLTVETITAPYNYMSQLKRIRNGFDIVDTPTLSDNTEDIINIIPGSPFPVNNHNSTNNERGRRARMWALRIFRMLLYILQNNEKLYIYHLSHMEVRVRDREMTMAVCELLVTMLSPPMGD